MNGQHFQTAVRRPTGDALEEFMLLNGRYSNFTKETFFIRYVSKGSYEENAARLQSWTEGGGARERGFVFERAVASQPPREKVERYLALYHGGAVEFPFRFQNMMWQKALERSFAQVLELFKQARGRSEDSIVRNFAVKLLYWMDTYFPRLFVETAKMNRFPKFACGGGVKLAEYLFLYLLWLLGCDVLYLSAGEDVSVSNPELLALSLRIEDAAPPPVRRPASTERENAPSGRVVITMDSVRRPERHRTAPPQPAAAPTAAPVLRQGGGARQPLEFEELAKIASSVVMLRVFDQRDQCFKTGSGVIISEKGYVLTNMHVVNGGRYYGIMLEEETDVFYTDELIKYHQDYDLAVLRMEKRRRPVPISKGGKGLVRGQRVVAIGSPLGLFNSVSDGIISGFRDMEKVSMIQFTAPVSHGSSGGALLDMYGELIGLITAGFDDGQNLNLAVGCQTIAQFVRGLI